MSAGEASTTRPPIRKHRRWLRKLSTAVLIVGWLAYASTWLCGVSHSEWSTPPSIPGLDGDWLPTDLRHSHTRVGAGLFSYSRMETPVGAGRSWVWKIADKSIRQRLEDATLPDKHWCETWVAYASTAPAIGPTAAANGGPDIRADRITVIDRIDRSTPSVALLVPFSPTFDWSSLWLWEYSREDGLTVTFPLWPPLLIVTIIWGRSQYIRVRASRRINRGACARCGYLRNGLAEHASCPECGTRQTGEVAA